MARRDAFPRCRGPSPQQHCPPRPGPSHFSPPTRKSGRSSCLLRAPPPGGDPGPRRLRQGTQPQGTDADSHTSAGCGPPSPGVGRPLPPRRPAGSPPSPRSLATPSRGPWGRHWKRKTPFPHRQGRRSSHAARGPDSSLFLSGMRGVTRPRMWRWGQGQPPRPPSPLERDELPYSSRGQTAYAARWRSNRRPRPLA